MFEIRELKAEDVPRIVATNGGVAWNGGFKKWNQRLAEHEDGRRIAWLAESDTGLVGYGSILWASPYGPFRQQEIPEIQDLVVAEAWRKQGIATALIGTAEERARRQGCKRIGMGVGLYGDYGSAQRLYVRMGYSPDGLGITCKYLPATPGGQFKLDDDLLLWLTKLL